MGTTADRLRHVAYVLDRMGIDDEQVLSVVLDNQLSDREMGIHLAEPYFRLIFQNNFTREECKRVDRLRHDVEGVALFCVVDKEPEGSGDGNCKMGVDWADSRGDRSHRQAVPVRAGEVSD